MVLLTTAFPDLQNFMQLIGVLLIFVFVLVLTYFTTKWLAGFQMKNMKNKNLKVVETLKVTNSKFIQIVEAGDVYLVIAIGKDEMNLLTTLTKEQLNIDLLQVDQINSNLEFSDILNKVKEHLPKSRH